MMAGIGGGGMNTVVSILMSDIVTLRERGVWQGIINIIFAFGAGLGAPLGMEMDSTVVMSITDIWQAVSLQIPSVGDGMYMSIITECPG